MTASKSALSATPVLVESVTPLTDTEKQTFESLVVKVYPQSVFDYQTNPLLIGGLKISFAGQVIDNSLQSRLNQVYQELLTHVPQ